MLSFAVTNSIKPPDTFEHCNDNFVSLGLIIWWSDKSEGNTMDDPPESMVTPFQLIAPGKFVTKTMSPVPDAVSNTSPVLSEVSDTFPVPLAAIVTEPFDVAPDCIVSVDADVGPVTVAPFWSTSMPFKLTLPVPVDVKTMVPLVVPDSEIVDVPVVAFPVELIVRYPSVVDPFTVNDVNCPTVCKLELITVVPSVVRFNTSFTSM